MPPDLSVVIPAYNEETRLLRGLERLAAYMADVDMTYELLLVDDGSTDRTAQTFETFAATQDAWRLISYPGNRGKGYALRQGVKATSGDLVLWSDADFSTPIEDFARLLPYALPELPDGVSDEWLPPEEERGVYDVVIASRALPESDLVIHQPWYRELGGRLGNLLTRLFLPRLWRLHDVNCGFKLLRGNVAREIYAACVLDGWGIDLEAVHIAAQRGYRLRDVPVTWRHCEDSKVSGLRAYVATFCELWGVRWRSWVGFYSRQGNGGAGLRG